MKTVEPSPEGMQQLGNLEDESPIVMINLLRYRDQADYQADYPAGFDSSACGGREAYGRYGAGVAPLIGKFGGRPIWMGEVLGSVIAPDGEAWDDAILVEYPNRKAFADMVTSPEYLAEAPHRTAALDDSRLIVTSTRMNLFGSTNG